MTQTDKRYHYTGLAFCIITGLIPFIGIDIDKSYSFLPSITGLIFFAIFTAQQKNTKFLETISIPTTILVGIILALSSLSILWSAYPDASLKKFIKLLFLLPPQILLISLARNIKSETLKPYINIIPIAVIATSCFLASEILTGGFIFQIIRGNDPSIATDPDDFNIGSVILILYTFCAFGILKQSINPFLACAAIFIPALTAIILSESQSAQLGIALGLITLIAFPYRSKIAFKILKFTILGLMFVTPFMAPYIYEHFATQLQDIHILARGYVGHRLEIWDYISRYALQSPILGHGIGVTRHITDFDSHRIFDASSQIFHPHNFVLQIWMEFGLIGIIAAAGFMYTVLTYIEKNYTPAQKRIILPTLIATLTPASLAYSLWQGNWIGLMFHVAAVTLISVNYSQNNSSPPSDMIKSNND